MERAYCMVCMEPLAGGVCPRGHGQTVQTEPHLLAPGTVLQDRYLIGRALGEGGFGITYIGRDLRLDMKVAVKEYFPGSLAHRDMPPGRSSAPPRAPKQRPLSRAGKTFCRRRGRWRSFRAGAALWMCGIFSGQTTPPTS